MSAPLMIDENAEGKTVMFNVCWFCFQTNEQLAGHHWAGHKNNRHMVTKQNNQLRKVKGVDGVWVCKQHANRKWSPEAADRRAELIIKKQNG